MKTKYYLLVICIIASHLFAYSQTEIIHPENHKAIILNKDGTWHYKKGENGYDCKKHTLTDSRDGKVYNTVTIGTQIWMAENLNYKTNSSWCFNNEPENCNVLGRLYSYNEAMHICPAGWHLPSAQEWRDLLSYLGGEDEAAKVLKSKNGWKSYQGQDGNGTNESGFNALPGGMRGDNRFAWHYKGEQAYFWTTAPMDLGRAWTRIITNENNRVLSFNPSKKYGLSVRCIKD